MNKNITQSEFDKIVNDAKASGGDFYHGSPEEGFAVYYYIDGVRCDFGFGHYSETETLINEMLGKPDVDLMKHLQISGLLSQTGVWERENEIYIIIRLQKSYYNT